MIESGLIFGLPLLTKDLIEQAARRRTYVLRVSPRRVLLHRQAVESPNQGSWSWPGNANQDRVLHDATFAGLGLHAVVYLALWFFLRHRALRDFSIWVGRTEPVGGSA